MMELRTVRRLRTDNIIASYRMMAISI